MKVHTPLDRDWTLRLDGSRHLPPQAPAELLDAGIAADVPGCVHTDLLAAGLIPDPLLDRNELAVAWVGRGDWHYGTRLPAESHGHERTDLVFDGLDTVASVTVGGQPLGWSRNMHRSYRYNVTDLVGQPLDVRFTSAYVEADRLRTLLGDRPNSYPEPFNFIRKMACNFGWDWGPTLVTAGIWREVRLEHWSTARLAEVRPVVSADGHVALHLKVERADSGAERTLRATVMIAGEEAHVDLPQGQDSVLLEITVPDVELWWPRGYGEQALYDCRVLLAADGQTLDLWTRRIGFRHIELDTSADEHGSGFTLVVNGTRVFARGVNWIPDDVFPSRITASRYRRRLEQAAAVGVDLIRVWGGGIYEDEDFYTACDELGLMVWQDFLFACAAYPEDEPLRSEIEAEARENVVRLMPHPSLVLWNGNNENLWGFVDWGWKEELADAAWGEGYYLGLLPRVVAELDPSRPYWAGSPWSGSWRWHPNDPDHGTAHSWEVWNRRDYVGYLEDVPRFVAEFGWQAPPAYATLRRAVGDDPLRPDSPGMLLHQKAEDGNGKLERGLAAHFPPPEDFDTWHYLTQVNQARAIATGVEHWRSHWPRCAGTILWQLNDCWPSVSWAAIDGDGREKPLYHELKRLYADRLLTFQTRDDELVLVAVNQSAAPWICPIELRLVDADGTVLAREHTTAQVAPRGVTLVQLPGRIDDPRRQFWVADGDGLRALHFAATDTEFDYPKPDLRIELSTSNSVTVTAHTLVRDLLLQADRLDPGAHTDLGLVTLLPGEQVTFQVHDWPNPNPAALPAVLRSVGSNAQERFA
ncbi:glycoside hydrolase family 2 protein [Kutzneria sp. CA-103260]|uniref:glycoside hydrolase family 2 protein n=1 Tax=Kutzneria sp. CA-103260 TaxID=2802641 RepID=UPI001BA608CA|nr:glycoside hydrolase family 2 protein [Kutzneria sp. CA-103260]QUQ65683.1 beta-mannosidase [Kutzneria sp. CA-103260]